MSPYNPDIHHRRSIRLKGYDYALEGLYFVTMCVQNRECLFGEIKNDEMVLNDAGRMVEKWYRKTQDKFPDIVCHEMIIMPNHFHCIWENVGLHGASAVGADPRVRPPKQNDESSTNNVNNDCCGINDTDLDTPNIIIGNKYNGDEGGHVGPHIQTNNLNLGTPNNNIDKYGGDKGGHMGPPLQENDILDDSDLVENITRSPLSTVVQWFKTMSTNEYIRGVKQLGWPPFDRKLWQRNYYEHVIRDDASLQTIAYYIINNPSQWQNDRFYQPSKSI